MRDERTDRTSRIAVKHGRSEVMLLPRQQPLTGALDGVTAWWVENGEGVACCQSRPIKQRHLAREDAIDHGRQLVFGGKWGKPS